MRKPHFSGTRFGWGEYIGRYTGKAQFGSSTSGIKIYTKEGRSGKLDYAYSMQNIIFAINGHREEEPVFASI